VVDDQALVAAPSRARQAVKAAAHDSVIGLPDLYDG